MDFNKNFKMDKYEDPNAEALERAKDIVSKKAINDDLKLLLRLFSKDEALKYLDAG